MPPLPHGQHLLDQLRKQRDAGFLCDCVVAIGEARFRAHRNVLAAFSKYFSINYESVTGDDVSASLDPDLVNKDVFEKLLHFVYTGDLNIDSGNVTDIFKAAEFLEMPEVIFQCEVFQEDIKPVEVGILDAYGHDDDDDNDDDDDDDGGGDVGGGDDDGTVVPGNSRSPNNCDPLVSEGNMDLSIQENQEPETPEPSSQVVRQGAKRGRKPKVRPETSSSIPPRTTRSQRSRAGRSLAKEAFTDASNKETTVVKQRKRQAQKKESATTAVDNGHAPECRPSSRKPAAKRGRKSGPRKTELKENHGSTEEGNEKEDADAEAGPERQQARVKPVCSTCGKTFSETSSLRRHLRIHKGVKPYVCQLCGRAFRQGNQLKTHVRIHTGEKPYQCNLCTKSFAQKCQLVFHCRMHHGEEKPYKCDVCGLQFATSSNFKIHMRKHSGEKPYECSCCNKRFAQASTLTYHIRRHTGEKPYVCDTCGKSFAVSSSLITHARKHTGETPYLCLVCGKTFMSSGELNKHFRTHTGAKRADCEFCGNSYTDVKYLRKHIAKMHKDEVSKDPGQVSFPMNIPIDHQTLIARAPPEVVDPPMEPLPSPAVLTESIILPETQFIFVQTLN